MRNRVFFVCMSVFWFCGAGCQKGSNKPVVVGNSDAKNHEGLCSSESYAILLPDNIQSNLGSI